MLTTRFIPHNIHSENRHHEISLRCRNEEDPAEDRIPAEDHTPEEVAEDANIARRQKNCINSTHKERR